MIFGIIYSLSLVPCSPYVLPMVRRVVEANVWTEWSLGEATLIL